MTSSGKKSKKHKGKTIPLTDFLADGTANPGPGKIVVHRNRTWAEEVENEDDSYYASTRSKQPVILPTAPRETLSARDVDEGNIPHSPPYKAYLVNLHYDTTESDILELFEEMKVVDVQLPRDDRGSGRLKGFGYIEFETREDLIAALVVDDTSIKGRRMRIEVSNNTDAGNNNSEQRRGAGPDRRYENREYDPERTQGDWRSGPREEPPLPTTAGKPTFGRNTASIPKDRGAFTRNNMDGPLVRDGESFTPRDNNTEQGSSSSRYNADASTKERGSFTRDNMDQMVRPDGAMNRDFRAGWSGHDGRFGNRDRYRDSNNMSRGANYGNSSYEGRDRHFENRRERNDSYNGDDRVHHQNYNNNTRNPPEPDTPAEVKTRPKLCLAQRTVAKTEGTPTASVQSPIFGGARPVDTAAREKEIEDNRMRQRESHGMRRLDSLEKDDVNEEVGTLTTNLDRKTFETGDQSIGVADEGICLDLEDDVESKEDDKCLYETPSIALEVDAEERLAKSEVIESHTPGKEEVEEASVVKQHPVQAPAVRSSIFGGATPVDTSSREREFEERLAKSTAEKIATNREKPGREVESLVMKHLQKPPARSTIFGGATPVDTSARDREVEQRLARECDEKCARDEWTKLAREKKGAKYRVGVNDACIYGGGADRPPPSVEAAGVREGDARRRVICNIDEQQMKKEDHERQQGAKKYELAQPLVENVWLRRAAQQAANQERGQMFAPPVAFKNTQGL